MEPALPMGAPSAAVKPPGATALWTGRGPLVPLCFMGGPGSAGFPLRAPHLMGGSRPRGFPLRAPHLSSSSPESAALRLCPRRAQHTPSARQLVIVMHKTCRPRRLLRGSPPPLPHRRKPWRPLQPSPPAAACRSCPRPPPTSDHTPASASRLQHYVLAEPSLTLPCLSRPLSPRAHAACLDLWCLVAPAPHTHPSWPLECELHRVHRSKSSAGPLRGICLPPTIQYILKNK